MFKLNINNITDKPTIAIFTKGASTDLKYFGESKSGTWKVDPNKEYDKVIIYHRNEIANTNTIYAADFIRTEEANDSRSTIIFNNVEKVETTDSSWFDFTGNKSSNPIKYFNI